MAVAVIADASKGVRSRRPVTHEPGRVPRVARLLALALRLDEQVRNGEMASYAEIAEVGHVTRGASARS